jgi:hypothetical protein
MLFWLPRPALVKPWRALPWAPSALLAQLVEHLHGKEGVDGSSPSEGFRKGQQMALFVASAVYTPSLEHPSACPQDLSPTSQVPSILGLSKGV